MADKRKSLSEKEMAIAGAAAVAGAAIAGVGAFLWSRLGRDQAPDEPQLRDRARGEVNFVDDGVQGY